MSYKINTTKDGTVLELSGGVTARHVSELTKSLASSLTTGAAISVRTEELQDVDTTVLQMLISLKKTASSFELESPSEVLIGAIERAALRRDLLTASKEGQ